jgi:hypothetical protein
MALLQQPAVVLVVELVLVDVLDVDVLDVLLDDVDDVEVLDVDVDDVEVDDVEDDEVVVVPATGQAPGGSASFRLSRPGWFLIVVPPNCAQ